MLSVYGDFYSKEYFWEGINVSETVFRPFNYFLQSCADAKSLIKHIAVFIFTLGNTTVPERPQSVSW